MLKAAVAHDMELIRTGQQGENYEHLKYVCFDKLSPRFNVVQVLMKTINTIEEPVSKGGRPTKSAAGKETIAIAGEIEEPVPIPQAKTNFFETISMEVVNGGKRR